MNSIQKIKNVRERVRRYGLRSQKNISFLQAEKLLASKGFVLNEKNKNCLFTNSGNESMKHWIVKAMIFKILRERKRTVGTEIETKNGIVDVIDVDNLIVYEIENGLNKRKKKKKLRQLKDFKDIFIIDLKNLPDSLKKLEEILNERIV
jgi:UTP-glucose-1-phosphate uridylyltransferase